MVRSPGSRDNTRSGSKTSLFKRSSETSGMRDEISTAKFIRKRWSLFLWEDKTSVVIAISTRHSCDKMSTICDNDNGDDIACPINATPKTRMCSFAKVTSELMRAHSWQTASVPCFSISLFYIKKRHKALKAIKNEIRMIFYFTRYRIP